MDREQISRDLRSLISEETMIADFDDDTDLIESGLLDSLLVVSIVSRCEEAFCCEFDLEELTEDNFRSLGAVVDMIARKLDSETAA